MARNTGRGSRAACQQHTGNEWIGTSSLPMVVWSEDGQVAIYEGEKEVARRRKLLTPDEADHLAQILRAAARDARV